MMSKRGKLARGRWWKSRRNHEQSPGQIPIVMNKQSVWLTVDTKLKKSLMFNSMAKGCWWVKVVLSFLFYVQWGYETDASCKLSRHSQCS